MVKPTVENAKCKDEELNVIVDTVEEICNNFERNADRAKEIKKEIDSKLDDTYQVIVGKNFATYVTHEEDKFCHLKLGNNVAIQIFKAGAN